MLGSQPHKRFQQWEWQREETNGHYHNGNDHLIELHGLVTH